MCGINDTLFIIMTLTLTRLQLYLQRQSSLQLFTMLIKVALLQVFHEMLALPRDRSAWVRPQWVAAALGSFEDCAEYEKVPT